MDNSARINRYQTEIDGIRAIAVISVMLFHINVGGVFTGGFVGVDVFFVISGYLITMMILDKINCGKFSLAEFFTRRARRLLPAYFFVLTLCLVFSALILSPPLLENFGGALIYSIYSGQNLYQIASGGYFDLNASLKPVLHTWSLSVEGQFYLFWPLMLIVLTSRFLSAYQAILLVLILAVASLMGAHIFSSKNSAFYFTPFRFFEFAIGASLCIKTPKPQNQCFLELSSTLGLMLVLGSIVGMDKDTPFPSLWTLIPCLGTCLLIHGGGTTLIGKGLSLRPVVLVGLLSYSLYLVHWPLYVLFQFFFMRTPTAIDQVILFAMSFVLAYVIYSYIEKPMRHNRAKTTSDTRFLLACATVALILLLPAAIFWAKGGWPSRFQQINQEEFLSYSNEMIKKSNDTFRTNAVDEFPDTAANLKINILVIGDSHSINIANSFFMDDYNKTMFRVARLEWDDTCMSVSSMNLGDFVLGIDSACDKQFKRLKASSLMKKADVIIVANYWSKKYFKGLKNGFYSLKQLTNAPIIIVGQNEVFPFLFNAIYRLGLNESLNVSQYGFRSDGAEEMDRKLQEIAHELELLFVNRRDLVCDQVHSTCEVFNSFGNLNYRDDNHWSFEGEAYFGTKFVKKIITVLPKEMLKK